MLSVYSCIKVRKIPKPKKTVKKQRTLFCDKEFGTNWLIYQFRYWGIIGDLLDKSGIFSQKKIKRNRYVGDFL